MGKKRASTPDILNEFTYKVIFDKFRLIAINAFEWCGLPEGITEEHLENLLFSKGKAIFFRDPKQSFMCLEAQDGTGLNVYGKPLTYNAVGFNYNKRYHKDDCVIIENNKLRKATYQWVEFYCMKLAEAERTMDVNVKANKTPVIVLCDDKDVLTFKNIFQKVDGNVPAIFADKTLARDSIEALDMKAKFLGNELMDYKKAVENELLTFLGINNTPTEKRERLITDEANSNNQLIDSFSDLQLEARERACKEINKMFHLNISVKRRQREEVIHNDVEKGVENDVA